MKKLLYGLCGALLVLFAAHGVLLLKNQAARQAASASPTKEDAFHYSAFSQKEFFDEAFSKAPALPADIKPENIAAVIVNHHLLAPRFIAQGMDAVATTKPVSVVLMSPNHFAAGSGLVLTSRYDWQTPYGVLPPDLKVISRLTASGLAVVEEELFVREHGISNIVAFIKKALPQAKLVPLIFKERLGDKQADALAKELAAQLPEGAVVVASLDFSHYHDLAAANLHDEASLAALSRFDYGGIKNLDVDSRPALRILFKYLEQRGAKTFSLLQHSNSAYITGSLDLRETTSYITGYFSK